MATYLAEGLALHDLEQRVSTLMLIKYEKGIGSKN